MGDVEEEVVDLCSDTTEDVGEGGLGDREGDSQPAQAGPRVAPVILLDTDIDANDVVDSPVRHGSPEASPEAMVTDPEPAAVPEDAGGPSAATVVEEQGGDPHSIARPAEGGTVTKSKFSEFKDAVFQEVQALRRDFQESVYLKGQAHLMKNKETVRALAEERLARIDLPWSSKIPCTMKEVKGAASDRSEGDEDMSDAKAEEPEPAPSGVDEYVRPEKLEPLPNAPRIRLRYAQRGGKPTRLHAEGGLALPQISPLPEYVAWQFLLQNQPAHDAGKRMYYTNEKGETVPASNEGDASLLLPWNSKHAAREDAVIATVLSRHRDDPRWTLRALADCLDVTVDQLRRYLENKHANTVAEVPEEKRQAQTIEAGVAALRAQFCRRCRNFHCKTHEGNQPCSSDPQEPAAPFEPGRLPCGPSCGLEQPDGSNQANMSIDNDKGPALSDGELQLFKIAVNIHGHGRPCSIARMLPNRTCAEVAAVLRSSADEGENGAATSAPTCIPVSTVDVMSAANVARRRRVGFGGPKKKKVTNEVVQRRLNRGKERVWPGYEPCRCEGQCDASCPCRGDGNFCEKYCCCAVDCPMRYQGCKCGRGQCRTRACPCYAAGRECDPDVCRRCSSTCAGTAPPGSRCHNMQLRLGQRKPVVMGMSGVSGWGAFLMSSAMKGECIGEYTGDLISQDEADRRGKVYDKINSSYLFNLNKQRVLDAHKAGNILRFANHCTNPNCSTRISMVDGDHRVGIFAEHDIAPGEELFYNYRYDGDSVPHWAR